MTTDVPPPTTAPSLPRNVRVLGFSSLLNDIASEMIFPLLPGFLLVLTAGNKFALGMIEGLADSVASLLKLWSGGWSDRAGRRKGFVVFGYSLAALVRPWIGVVGNMWQLAAIRVGDRIGKGIRTSPRDAMIADSTAQSQRGRAFGFHRAMDHLGAAIGPLLATAFLWFWPEQIRTLFMLTLIPGLLVVGLVVFGLKETPPTRSGTGGDHGDTGGKETESHSDSVSGTGDGVSGNSASGGALAPSRVRLTLAPFDANFRLFLLALVIFSLGNSSDAFLLLRAEELGVPRYLLPVLWCLFHILKSYGNWWCGAGVDRYGPKPFILLGWFVYAVIYICFAFAVNAWQVWAIFLSYALFYGLTEPAEKTLVAALAGPERKGLAFGWFNFAIGISTLPASLLFGALYQVFGPLTAFGTGAALALVASVLVGLVQVPPNPR
jgi:MFS family permease